MTDQLRVYQYWFGGQLPNMKLWFGKSDEADRYIREQFQECMDAPDLNSWTKSPQGWVAQIVLLDQFPRNAFRGTARMFAYDQRALTSSKAAVSSGLLKDLNIFEALFVLLPFEHSESLADQDECLERMTVLSEKAEPEQKEFTRGLVDYARRHHEIISRFGRFPHRNSILGRKSTDAELEFLKQPGSHF